VIIVQTEKSKSANKESPANSPDFANSLALGWSGIVDMGV